MGRFTLEQSHSLDDVLDRARGSGLVELLVPPAGAVADLPQLRVDAEGAEQLRHGRAVSATGEPGPVAAVDDEGRLLAIVADADGRARPQVVFEAAGGRPAVAEPDVAGVRSGGA